MPGGSIAIEDDDNDLAKLMPNMAKLIRLGDSSSLESKGSTSMSFSENSVKGDVERQSPKPGRQRRRESVFREVANKFLHRGATDKHASKPSALATLRSNCRVGGPPAERWKNAHALQKENVRPKSPALVKEGARSILQQNLATRDVSQKVSKKFRKLPSRSAGSSYFSVNSMIQRVEKSNNISLSEKMTRPAATVSLPKVSRDSQGSEPNSRLVDNNERGKAKLYMTTMPLNLSELKEEFAEIDEEALEEEEVSVARMIRKAPVTASEILLRHTDDVLQNSVENRKDLAINEREKVLSDTVNEKITEAALPILSHVQEGAGICTSQSMASKTHGQVQVLQVSVATGKGNDAVLRSGQDRNAMTSTLRQLNPTDNQELDGGNQGDTNKIRKEENPPRIEQVSASRFPKRLNDKARENDVMNKTTVIRELTVAKSGSCVLSVNANGRPTDSKTASVLEMSGKRTRASAQFELTNAEASCNHKRGNSPTNPDVDKLEVTKGDGPDENAAHREDSVPRLSSTIRDVRSSLSKAQRLEQEDAPGIPLQGGNFSARDTSATPPRLHYCRRGRINGMNQRRLTFESSSGSKQKAAASAMYSDSISTVEFKGQTNSAASGEMGNDPYCFTSPSPQDRATECLKIRGLGKRTWANLGAPVDGGREWKEGRRVSTRIKSRPLDWWRGERMLYGRVHSTLCTLIGIKTTSPDPVWPRPKPQRGDYTLSNFHVDSFVDDSHCELLRLAAQ